MTQETFIHPRNSLDPIVGFDIYGYFYNKLEDKKELFLHASELTIIDNTFILERAFANLKVIREYTSEFKRKFEKEELTSFPKLTLVFNSFDLGYSINSSNKHIIKQYTDIKDTASLEYAKENSTTYELNGSAIDSLEYGIMPGRRVICSKITGIFDLVNSYKESYNDFVKTKSY